MKKLLILLLLVPNLIYGSNFCNDFENHLTSRTLSNDFLIGDVSEGSFGFYISVNNNSNTIADYLDNDKLPPYTRDEDNYLIIQKVEEDSPFHKASIRHNDRLVKINDIEVSELSDDEYKKIWSEISKNEIKFTFKLAENSLYNERGVEDKDGFAEKVIKPGTVRFANDVEYIISPIDLIEVRPAEYEYDLEYETDIFYEDFDSKNFFNNYKSNIEEMCIYSLDRNENPFNKYNLFNPKIFAENIIENKSEKPKTVIFSFYPKTGEDEGTVYVEIIERKVSTFSQYFDFHLFPFEKHSILTTLTSFYSSYSTNQDMTYSSKALYNSDNLINEYFTPGFEMLSSDFYLLEEDNYIEESRHLIDTVIGNIIEIERRSFYYIAKIMAPIFLILLLSWSVFFLKPKDLESRLTVSIICFLSLIAYNFVIEDSIPKLDYYTWMDWYVSFSYLFCGLTTFFTVYDYQLVMKNKRRFNLSGAMRSSGILIFIFLNITTFYIIKFQNEFDIL